MVGLGSGMASGTILQWSGRTLMAVFLVALLAAIGRMFVRKPGCLSLRGPSDFLHEKLREMASEVSVQTRFEAARDCSNRRLSTQYA